MAEGSYPNSQAGSAGFLQRDTGDGLEPQSSDSHGANFGATNGNAGNVRRAKIESAEEF